MTAPRRDWRWGAALAARLILAAVLIVAAVPKILDPYAFSLQIRAYDMLGEGLSRWLAVVLPWLELLTGLLLLGGVWLGAASALASGMMIMFSIAIVSAMARGLKIDCGCFGSDHSDPVGWPLLARDIGFLILSGYLLWYSMWQSKLLEQNKSEDTIKSEI